MDWASVPVRHRPPQTVSFRVADRVAGVFAWQTAWHLAFKDSENHEGPSQTECGSMSRLIADDPAGGML